MPFLSLRCTGTAMITLPPPYCAVCSPITAICSLLNSRGREQLGCELEVVAYLCVRARVDLSTGWLEEEGRDTKRCLIFDKQRGLLCAAAVCHIFSRLLSAVRG